MSDIHTQDFAGKRLKDIYHSDDGEALELEFENGFKIIVKGVRESGFIFKKERIGGESEEQKQKKQREKKKALAERKEKESKRKNRPKQKS